LSNNDAADLNNPSRFVAAAGNKRFRSIDDMQINTEDIDEM